MESLNFLFVLFPPFRVVCCFAVDDFQKENQNAHKFQFELCMWAAQMGCGEENQLAPRILGRKIAQCKFTIFQIIEPDKLLVCLGTAPAGGASEISFSESFYSQSLI